MARKPSFTPPTGSGDLGVSDGAGGPVVLDQRPRGHWALLTSRGAGEETSGSSPGSGSGVFIAPTYAYGHVAVVPNDDGTWTEAGDEWPSGTPTSFPAYEASHRDDVPTEADGEGLGAIVWLEPLGEIGFSFTYEDNTAAVEYWKPRFARLTGLSGVGFLWSWQEKKFSDIGDEQDGPTSGTFNARPLPFWPNSVSFVVADGMGEPGTLVVLWPDGDGSGFVFFPIIYADATRPGFVSTTTQDFAGDKNFGSSVDVAGSLAVGVSAEITDDLVVGDEASCDSLLVYSTAVFANNSHITELVGSLQAQVSTGGTVTANVPGATVTRGYLQFIDPLGGTGYNFGSPSDNAVIVAHSDVYSNGGRLLTRTEQSSIPAIQAVTTDPFLSGGLGILGYRNAFVPGIIASSQGGSPVVGEDAGLIQLPAPPEPDIFIHTAPGGVVGMGLLLWTTLYGAYVWLGAPPYEEDTDSRTFFLRLLMTGDDTPGQPGGSTGIDWIEDVDAVAAAVDADPGIIRIA